MKKLITTAIVFTAMALPLTSLAESTPVGFNLSPGGVTLQIKNPLSVTKDLSIGSKNTAEIKKLQMYLNLKGYLPIVPDGNFGPKTRAAVLAFQRARGLSATGYVGALTRAKIDADTTAQALYDGRQEESNYSANTAAVGTVAVSLNNRFDAARVLTADTARTRIGSFVIQNRTKEGVKISSVHIGVTVAGVSLTNFSNLGVMAGSLELGSVLPTISATQDITVSDTVLPPNENTVVNIYADLGPALGGTVTTTLLPTLVGVNSATVYSPSAAVNGQTLTIGSVSVVHN